ncbi:MAG: galactose mutarotase [Saccharospirillum sp.]|nr:galactose mutarotase [Saccharospirillum sp.]
MTTTPIISEEIFGDTADGRTLKRFVLRNAKGTEAEFCDLGAALMGFRLGGVEQPLDVVLGCDSAEHFRTQRANFGATIGRYANRIGKGRCLVDGMEIQLDVNTPPHHLHGGRKGFSQLMWESHISLDESVPTLVFRLTSPDGDMGYPGELEVEQRIQLLDDNSLCLNYRATTTKSTPINLTNHVYFNLSGATSGHLQDHEFRIHSDRYTEADASTLPTGVIKAVEGTVFDLRDWTSIGDRLSNLDDPELNRARGYDHNYIFGDALSDGVQLLAEVSSVTSGMWLKCFSDLPGMQFYSGNFLGGTPKNDAEHYQNFGAFCMEPGYWPDSPNHDHFPDCILRPGQSWQANIVYQIGKE